MDELHGPGGALGLFLIDAESRGQQKAEARAQHLARAADVGGQFLADAPGDAPRAALEPSAHAF